MMRHFYRSLSKTKIHKWTQIQVFVRKWVKHILIEFHIRQKNLDTLKILASYRNGHVQSISIIISFMPNIT